MRSMPEEVVSPLIAFVWSLLSFAFASLVALVLGFAANWAVAGQYYFGLLLNVVLSPDNLMVFMLFLKQAQLPAKYHRRAISDGMLLAIALRIGATLGGAAALARFGWLQLVLAAMILANGVKMLFEDSVGAQDGAPAADPSEHWAVRMIARCVPVVWHDSGTGYWMRDANGRLGVTRMAAVVVAIGCTDLTFAMDSIAAIIAITPSPFVMVFAQVVLGTGARFSFSQH